MPSCPKVNTAVLTKKVTLFKIPNYFATFVKKCHKDLLKDRPIWSNG